MIHHQLFPCVWSVGIHTIEGTFCNQMLQHHVSVREVFCSLLDMASGLHAHMEDEIAEVKIVGGVVVPCLSRPIINTSNHLHGCTIGSGVVVSRDTRAGI